MPTSLETQVRAIAQSSAYHYADLARADAYSYANDARNAAYSYASGTVLQEAYAYASYWIQNGGGGVNVSATYYWTGYHTFSYGVHVVSSPLTVDAPAEFYGTTTFSSGCQVNFGGYMGATVNFGVPASGYNTTVYCNGSTWDFTGATVNGLTVTGGSVDTSAAYYWTGYHTFSYGVSVVSAPLTVDAPANFYGTTTFSSGCQVNFGGYLGATVNFGEGATINVGDNAYAATMNVHNGTTVNFGGSGGAYVNFSNSTVTVDSSSAWTFTNTPTFSGNATWSGSHSFTSVYVPGLFSCNGTVGSLFFGGSTGTTDLRFGPSCLTHFESSSYTYSDVGSGFNFRGSVEFGGFVGFAGSTLNFNSATISNFPQSAVTNLTTDLAGKQDTLVSGTNIKTVGGVTLLGSGDVPLPSPVLAIRPDATASTALASTDDYVVMTSASANAVTIGTSLTVGKTYYIKQSGAGPTTLTFSGVTPNYSGFSGIAGTVARQGGVVSIIMTSASTCDVFGDYA